ncbi:hypothetical protein M9458_025772 [Cirrhinus mrigala]|uniref:CCHC-type domain-containing protein n=1 Tax=Cirrhinus mrigala TaxID=683832 RepID=A0ABD0Q209_CIRMR
MFRLHQGSSSVNEYTLHFRTLAASGWNETVLLGAYRRGLNPEFHAAMALYDDSVGLKSFLQWTTRVSQRLAACQPPVTAPQSASVAACVPVPETMQVDSTRLSRTERNCRISLGLCLYCGNQGHLIRTCPVRPPRPVVSTIQSKVKTAHLTLLAVVLCTVYLSSTQVESPEPEIPAEYVAFEDVFSKQEATHLPPHRPWDCAIELLPGAQLPKGRIYPLSILEHQAMEEYIAEVLKQGFIQPSTLPPASSFFFLGKKDGGLRPRIDYCQLNSQIIQQPYPLPRFVEPRSSRSWTCRVHGLYNTHGDYDVKELQRFLGFPNFCRRFIKDYSSITAPLTSLLRGKPKHLAWNPVAHEAFQRLKNIFSTAPLLHHPDPEHPFIAEVDASTVGVGAVLSQMVSESSLLHPCAFFSHKLSPAEQNYDVGNRELLAIKLALEEWLHWLEGATHPFTIITDHKNLQYL